ncbi:Crp/Fnr family transcriptional regulator [Zobellia galactanivorans]|uniref:Crp/Fnr family transcriptional regulator n=1 Tax=Zobellia TaxID=112040 RepID=UPI000B5382FB|nr:MULTISPECIES: Crp/Fnr family transcriptional regulator [Zobellia]MBU3024747.1 Crp/Fnr family transcriptional regulator [Zobellia galactanivorans]MDO6810677.1 Crp/Fnr family transcriptional regulator [Zobellia galactanivorans]OWW23369.1 cyclic nucleotide-binding protein [Zobellia sp. OII3]
MENSFFENIYNHPNIKKEDYNTIIDAHTKVEFLKNETILKEGKISNEYYLVKKGLFRSYVIDYKGNEITTDFFGSNDILIEVASLFLRIPTKETIQAITDCEVYKIEFNDFQNLYSSIDGFTEWGRSWMSHQLFIAKHRAVTMHTQSASQRYLELMNQNPQIIKEVPLKHIATYLGITDTSLSRIRKEVLFQTENLS